MTPKLIKQISSGELYVWTPELAARTEEFEAVEKEVATPEPVLEEQVDEQQPQESLDTPAEVSEELPVVEEVKPAPKKKGK